MSHIIIIDDDHQIRLMLKKLLEIEGYTVTVAKNGKDGIKEYRKNPADLIITDIIMPEKEGLETINELKKEFSDIKIIAISGGGKNNPDTYLYLAKKLGAIHTFYKPIKKKDLLKVVKNLI